MTEMQGKIYLTKDDMPRKCASCPFLNGSDECTVQGEDVNFNAENWDDLMRGCPLEEIKAPQVANKAPLLRPCPFCGRKAEIVCTSTSANSNATNGFARFFKLWCPKCGCQTGGRPIPVTFDYSPHTGMRADETELLGAIERWNRRADNGKA